MVLLPFDLRVQLLQQYLTKHGVDALTQLFAQFIGMANSVVANNREMAELVLISEGNVHPHTAEKINLPTLFGAAMGAKNSLGIAQGPLCIGCAYRIGSAANQSPVTTIDAQSCKEDGEKFMCHENLDGSGKPTKLCVGHAHAMRVVAHARS
jgi:hypothetical protein